jgi:hypothetical protein
MDILIDNSLNIDDLEIYITLIKLFNSYLLLISDQKQMGIGNVTLGTPSSIEGLKSITSSYQLFGGLNDQKLLNTIITEKASHILKKPVLLLLFLKGKYKEKEIAKPLLNFLNDVFKEAVEKEEDLD